MISRIQNVSFTGARQRVANKVAKDFEEAYVSASSNLKGTVNEVEAARNLRDAEFAKDKDTFIGRVASLLAAKRNVEAPVIKAVEEEKALTPAEIAAAQELKNEYKASSFFG